jgi:phosphate starvation-inducible PhoH-like protein
LTELCGVNDSNLQVIEDLLEERVFTHGNELLLDSSIPQKIDLFEKLIAQLKDHLKLGHQIGEDLIRSIHFSLVTGDIKKADFLKDHHILIPNHQMVVPRNYHQAQYIQAMEKDEIVFGVGPAGTGKTYLAVAYALKTILSGEKRKLILTRPVVEVGESLGFLPGDLAQKISPYLRPLYDAMESLVSIKTLSKLEENRVIEIAPLAYMRGRSLNNCFIILDEAQNTTKEQMKMFLTRIGERSKAIITGDVTQIDLPQKKNSGLLQSISILKNIANLHFSFFDAGDVVRNPLVKKIIHAYETYEK